MIYIYLAQETMDAADRELEPCSRGAGLALARGLAALAALAALAFTRHVWSSEVVEEWFCFVSNAGHVREPF